MNRNMANETRPKDKEGKASGLIKIDVAKKDGEGRSGGFKKGGFKSAFKKVGDEAEVKVKVEDGVDERDVEDAGSVSTKVVRVRDASAVESDTEDEGYECYDPRRPTGCESGCKGRA